MGNGAAKLRDLVDELNEELERSKERLAAKDSELCQTRVKCKTYADQLDAIRQDVRVVYQYYIYHTYIIV